MRRLFLITFLVLGVEIAAANDYLFGAPASIALSSISVQMLPKNPLRAYLLIQNQDATNSILVKFGSVQSSATDGIIIPAGGNYEPLGPPSNSVWGRTVSAPSGVVTTTIQGQ